jgi:hypothetical protein
VVGETFPVDDIGVEEPGDAAQQEKEPPEYESP